jgi:predicted TIM-barrel fold metal-dependent hydrolase
MIDCHFHLWRRDMPLVKGAWHINLADATIERLVEVLDEHGVTFGVVAAASVFGSYNDYMREAMKQHRRLRATAIVDPATSLYELEQMKADGFVGIRLVWAHLRDVPDLNSDEYRRLFRRVADLDWLVHFIEREARTGPLIAALEKHGVSKIVVDHFGHFETGQPRTGEGFKAILAAVDRGKTWVKLSGGFRFDPLAARDYAKELLRVNGGDRLLWGSDWPFMAAEDKVSYADTIASFRDWVPTNNARRKIGAETPLKLYFT